MEFCNEIKNYNLKRLYMDTHTHIYIHTYIFIYWQGLVELKDFKLNPKIINRNIVELVDEILIYFLCLLRK